MISQVSPQECTGSPASDFEGGGIEDLTIAEEFWLAMARNDRTSTKQIVTWLKVPPVAILAYSFELIESKEDIAAEAEDQRQEEASGVLTPKGVFVMPSMPTEAVIAWNSEALVALVVVSKSGICGARVGDGEINFLACAGAVDQTGGTSCGWGTHEMGGKDTKKQNIMKISLPDEGEVFAIPVNASRSLVKRPKIFSTLVLPRDKLPYDIFNAGWDKTLTTIRLMARVWKYLIKAYPGEAWMVNSYLKDLSGQDQGGRAKLPKLSIPSPPSR